MAPLADLDHINLEAAKLGGHSTQFVTLPDPPGVRPEFIAVYVGNGDKAQIPAYRAWQWGWLTVEFGRPEQVGVGIAELTAQRTTVEKGMQGATALECEIHDRTR